MHDGGAPGAEEHHAVGNTCYPEHEHDDEEQDKESQDTSAHYHPLHRADLTCDIIDEERQK